MNVHRDPTTVIRMQNVLIYQKGSPVHARAALMAMEYNVQVILNLSIVDNL